MQVLNPHLEKDTQLSLLKASSPLKPIRLSCLDVRRPASTFIASQSFLNGVKEDKDIPVNQSTIGIRSALRQGFVELVEGNVNLLALKSSPTSLHQRSIDSIEIREQFKSLAILGNPDIMAPTYVAGPRWNGETYGWETVRYKVEDRIVVRIDPQILFEQRSIFIDPETINQYADREDDFCELGRAFFVLGGIPKEAILQIEYPWRKSNELKSDWGSDIKIV